MSRKILLPIDLGDPKGTARPLAEALTLLGPQGVLHVVSVFPDFGLSQVGGYFRKDYEKEALKALGKALSDWTAAHVPDGVEFHPHVLHGTIYDEILRAADKLAVDVIVIGANRPALRDYLLGPNAARVVRHANCSVYVVRG
ncbi:MULTISPECIES: universal stress protein [unclassified Paracoccus (in: a-proteobacteria)]|uniref:universal stress protein n=1 Tax=unclassified Paracoccus (in: a-proteobacteria) TaxID=2688777 RepID=UPI0012B26A55|nr:MULTISPECIES: universal stress protein [unclassified Paracoccus (in: a-proteobacteria)]UXU76562.1 universal stress protein [Paracoccus sp. SMMA_5]UXU82341.1 universal stress protein [Paracoccus sp. SMMA_5_TC]